MSLQVGDAITLLWLDAPNHVVMHARVGRIHPPNGLFSSMFETEAVNATYYTRCLSGEGHTWIRGHHAADSEACRALLAAAILST